MVTEQAGPMLYICDVCGKEWDKLEGATYCESRGVNKSTINGDRWKEGDYIVYSYRKKVDGRARNGFAISRIINTEVIGHDRFPVYAVKNNLDYQAPAAVLTAEEVAEALL